MEAGDAIAPQTAVPRAHDPAAAAAAAVAAAPKALLLDKDVHMLWLAFVTFFGALILVAGGCFVKTDGSMPSARASIRQGVFWSVAAFTFNGFVLAYLGSQEAKSWLIGYCLEYVLSFDNLFIFHLIFTAYRAPQAQIYRGIFFGMCWGTWVRLTIYVIGEQLFNSTAYFKWIFGSVLMYSGVKVIFFEEEDTDPTDNILVRSVSRCIPLHPHYTSDSAFFVCIDETERDNILNNPQVLGRLAESSPDSPNGRWPSASLETGGRSDEEMILCQVCLSNPAARQEMRKSISPRVDQAIRGMDGRGSWKATPLLLALVSLLVVDAVLSMDSVTAKVSMVSQYDDRIDLFLNFTSTAFAMLCMPTLYFVIELMIPMFRFLKYGIGTILVLIGLKLLLAWYINVREETSCIIMLCIISVSIFFSLLLPEGKGEKEKEPKGRGMDEFEHVPAAADDAPSNEDLVAAVTTLVAGAASVGDDCDPHGAALQPIAEGGEA